jgi:DNA invertase Pin-like site-specific DNA recombinase
MLTVFGALSELERESILQRQAEGIAIEKANGVYKGRKPKQIDEDKFIAMCREWRDGKRTATSIQKVFSITGTTFYKWVKQREL